MTLIETLALWLLTLAGLMALLMATAAPCEPRRSQDPPGSYRGGLADVAEIVADFLVDAAGYQIAPEPARTMPPIWLRSQ